MYTLEAEGKQYAVAVRNGSVNVELLPNGLKEAWQGSFSTSTTLHPVGWFGWFGWLVGRLAGWLAGWLVGGLVGWWVGWTFFLCLYYPSSKQLYFLEVKDQGGTNPRGAERHLPNALSPVPLPLDQALG